MYYKERELKMLAVISAFLLRLNCSSEKEHFYLSLSLSVSTRYKEFIHFGSQNHLLSPASHLSNWIPVNYCLGYWSQWDQVTYKIATISNALLSVQVWWGSMNNVSSQNAIVQIKYFIQELSKIHNKLYGSFYYFGLDICAVWLNGENS